MHATSRLSVEALARAATDSPGAANRAEQRTRKETNSRCSPDSWQARSQRLGARDGPLRCAEEERDRFDIGGIGQCFTQGFRANRV